jgi:hypothetical protein
MIFRMSALFIGFVIAAHAPTLWGDIGFGCFPAGEKVSPNGLVFDPLCQFTGTFNFGSSAFHGFIETAFFMEKANPGVTTNKSQGEFDFTRRQFDFDFGLALRVHRDLELRVWNYSESNLNRGTSKKSPSGFVDGLGSGLRYRLSDAAPVSGNVTLGYYFTKTQVDTAGKPFKPSVFADCDLALPLSGNLSAGARITPITERPVRLKRIDSRIGAIFSDNARVHSEIGFYYERDVGYAALPDIWRFLIEYKRRFAA